MRRTAVFTVVFPSNLPYLDSFLNSILSQTFGDFDLILFNDGIDAIPNSLESRAEKIIPVSGTPSKIRERGIEFLAASDYDSIIFADSDDRLAENRVEKSLEYLKKSEIVVNDLSMMTKEGKLLEKNFWSSRLDNGKVIDRDFIRRYNILGLGNTAVLSSVLRKMVIPETVVAADWFIYEKLLMGSTALFTNETVSYYRQHANLAGLGVYTPESINNSILVSKIHHKAIGNRESELSRIADLERYLQDENNLNHYIQLLKQKYEHPYWWELPYTEEI